MPFPTAAFAVFFVAAFTVNWLLRPHLLVWRATMIVVSLYFCAWVDVRFALVIIGAAVVNGALAAGADRSRGFGGPTPASRWCVRAAVVADVALLGVVAYHGFFLDSVTGVLDAVGLSATAPALDLLVPVGLSFVTLNAISYVVDVGRGDVEPVSGADLLLYLAFFPHLVAGPPVRVDELVPQFHERPDPRKVPATEAFSLIGVGLVKAVVIAGYLGDELVDPAFADPSAAGGPTLVVALYAFAVQIYAGFSGLTDIAVGCGLLLGVEYPRPFDAPYRSLSVREFWDRWNTPVSHWLRDYVYIPLGGDRSGAATTYRNLVATMVVGALWYGAGWPFAVWGTVHGGYLVAERALRARSGADPDEAATAAAAAVRWLVTFNLVVVAWVFYRADTVGTAAEVLGRIVTVAPGGAVGVPALAVPLIVAAVAAQFVPADATVGLRARFTTLAPALQVVALAAVLTLVSALGPDGALPYRYLPF
ncbi:MAG TPA: MBOAT family O-acyltransferase [Acidimicrobiales bacterium]|nr:MBOAT family O-acyltransferase [Acidimicrobiales bacterium]